MNKRKSTKYSPFLDAVAVAAELGLSRPRVYALWKRGDLPYVTVGGRKLLTEAAFEQWMSDKTAEALRPKAQAG